MASGDLLFILEPQASCGPTTTGAIPTILQDASTPPMDIPVLQFSGAADRHADWFVTIPPQYSNDTGFTFSYKYAMDGVDGNIVEMEFRVLPLADLDVLTGDLGMDGQTEVAITDDPATTANQINYTTTGTLAKANFGSAVAGTRVCIRATYDVTANSDDLYLIEVKVTET
jgi:hypothetical protein